MLLSHVCEDFQRKAQEYCMMPQLQCLNRRAEGCTPESSDPSCSARPQALKRTGNSAGPILLRHVLTSARSTAPTAASSLLLILLQGSLKKGRKGRDFKPLFPSFSPEPFSRRKQHLAHSRAQMAANMGCSRGSAFFVHCPPPLLFFLFTQDSRRDPRLHPGHMVLTQSTSIHTPAGLITRAHTHKTHTHIHCCIGSLAFFKSWTWLDSPLRVTV